MLELLSNPAIEKIFISICCLAVIVSCIYMLIKASGLFYYSDVTEQKQYEQWIKKEGLWKKIYSIIGLLVAMYGWIKVLIEF